jgi:hypothetical protein
MDKVIAVSHGTKGLVLDDDYTLFESGKILHEFDNNIYPGGFNKSEELTADQLSPEVKDRLVSASSDENREIVKKILKTD